MKLSISNIAWTKENDNEVYEFMRELGYSGLEIAPTRVFGETPYNKLKEASEFKTELKERKNFCIPSMQSLWNGRSERLFGSPEERLVLSDYTKEAIRFAKELACGNLVFGCPKNRNTYLEEDFEIGLRFFRELGDYAVINNTVIGFEANPVIYGTNYMNDTLSAIQLVENIKSTGLKLNLDLGAMIYNEEKADILQGKTGLVNHVHISEPNLKIIEKRKLHREVIKILSKEGYDGYISVEMQKVDDLSHLYDIMSYVKEIVYDI